MCKRSARPNGEVCKKTKSICNRCMSVLMNGVRVCVCDPIICVQHAITVYETGAAGIGLRAWVRTQSMVVQEMS